MNEALRLRKMSVAQMAAQNILYQGGLNFSLRWIGQDWNCRLQYVRTVMPREVRIVADWGGAEVRLLTDLHWLESATQVLLQETDISSLPEQLRLALIESAITELADQLEAGSKKSFRVKSLMLVTAGQGAEVDLDNREAIAWKAESHGREFEGEMLLDASAMMFASAAAKRRIPQAGSMMNIQALPVRLQFVIGSTTLPLSAFKSMQVRDVILLDESLLQQQETLTVMVANNAVFRASLSGAQLVVTEGLANVMDELYEENEFATSEIVNDLPVKLTFDLGERVLPLAELQMIAPGTVFDLGRDLRQGVVIRANGMRVGEGELIDIEGRTGVAILSISGQFE